jgi:hypothetical protein
MSEQLSHDDFACEDSKLRLLRKGAFAVLFMTKGDSTSASLINILKQIRVGGMETGYLDISKDRNKEVILMSRKTNSPISTVPYLAIFYEGRLKCRYKSDVDVEKIRTYCQKKVIELASEIKMPSKGPVNATNAQQFAMARSQGPSGSTNTPDPAKIGIIGYNKAHLIDMAKN